MSSLKQQLYNCTRTASQCCGIPNSVQAGKPSWYDANSIISPGLIIDYVSVREIISPASYIYGMVVAAKVTVAG